MGFGVERVNMGSFIPENKEIASRISIYDLQ